MIFDASFRLTPPAPWNFFHHSNKQGYHIYAAAVVAKYDQEWGRKFFDRVMLYIRDIANPFADDAFFPQYRHKDWFLGSSWASGFISADTPHGRNQESSSEAIAAYEAVTLFGDVMVRREELTVLQGCNLLNTMDAKN